MLNFPMIIHTDATALTVLGKVVLVLVTRYLTTSIDATEINKKTHLQNWF
jgi:hypothetical protein